MYCGEKHCLNIQKALYNNLVQYSELKKMLLTCYKCFKNSKDITAKNTSSMVDLKFAETLLDLIDKKDKEMKEFQKILNDLKNDIADKNALSKEDEAILIKTIQKAVEKGEIVLRRREDENEFE